MPSPVAGRDALQPDPSISSIVLVRQSPPIIEPASSGVVKFAEGPTTHEEPLPPSSEGASASKNIPDHDISPTTPGVDDTPYIRFAIDQLTRDEELLGSRLQGAPSEASYPVDRIISDEGLGYYGYDRQLSRAAKRSEDRDMKPSVPPCESKLSSPKNPSSVNHLQAINVLQPLDPTHDSFRCPKLAFIPRALQPISILPLIFCCVLMIAALIFCNVWSSQKNGFSQYNGVESSRYFLFQFLPQLFAIIILIWLFTIQSAIQRVFPFSVLASPRRMAQNSSVLDNIPLFPTTYLIPNFAFLRCGEPVLGLCYIVFWLCLFTVPLQSCLFQTQYHIDNPQDIWLWTTVRPIGWALVVLYGLLTIALFCVMIRFILCQTGLKWDPVSLADILVLFNRSNIISDFEGLEIAGPKDKIRTPKAYRLGYWTTTDQDNDVYYGIGEEQAAVQRYPPEDGKAKMKVPGSPTGNYDLEGQRPIKTTTLDSLQTNIHSCTVRYQWLPWFLKDTFVVAWIVIAVILMLTFIIVSFVNKSAEKGFLPLLPAPTTSQGFSPANFLYSFIPSLIGLILFLLWQPIDLYFRALQPFADLSNPRGTTAENSLLLDYPACLPFEITVKAALAGHYKVAYISLISLISATIPVLAGGVFTAQFFAATQDVRMAASLPGYIALVFFIVVYALSFLAIWPTHKRRLPHDISTLGQLISFVYQSPLLADATFREPRSKIDLVTRLLGAPAGEKASPRYAFGVYIGMDEKEHLGIDRLQRPGSGEMLVTTGTLGK